ncbi:hypothetical protein LTR84_010130 [Exophiala bonariae]|uniref:Xylanolytic transcriptional activator regulatory domain-containing protein n=1 Tax=Exophiala bonariae TaxID=1690606 RepID=A0AAV9NKE0_9EURO|nr:hypothetical protein LTR84_010130 [Exophiala bonariae]
MSILATAIGLSLRAGDALPGLPSDPMTTIANFHQRSTECLLLSHYWKPKQYTIEALLMNLQIEFIRSKHADLSVWTLTGTITRLAMSMGYHRDPAQYPQISCFHGEMRRRVWAGIVQLDIFFSFQLGLPRMIATDQCDTLPPRNLLDSDFDIHVTELPPARPDTEYTPPSYTIAKGRLLAVFADIANLSCSVQAAAYHHYLALDKQLNEAYAAVPDHLRVPYHDAGVTLTVAAPVIVRQHLLELLYQKSRCILHREYMVKARNDSTFMYSRSTCVDAAMALLAQQVTVRTQVQDGGVLHRDRWLIMTSLHHTDFILAAMIVCLELSFRIDGGPRQPRLVDELGRPRYENDTLVQALRGSYQIWLEWKGHAKVSPQAARILSVMLSRAAVGPSVAPTSDFPRPGIARQNGSHHGRSP